MSTSSSLLRDLKVHDEKAWDRFVTLYSPLVYGWCRRAAMGEQDAADVMQDVFVTVRRRIATYDRIRGRFRSWLKTITRSRICDAIRARQDAPEAVGGSAHTQRIHNIPDDWDEAVEAQEKTENSALKLRAAELVRAEFEENTWQAFWRTAVEGHDASSVAAELGMTIGAVYTAKSRVLKRLREELADLM